MPSPVVIVGVGDIGRGDDGVGAEVARQVAAALPQVDVVVTDPSRLLDALDGAHTAYVVDAVRSGAPPGALHRLDAVPDDDGERAAASSHGLGLGEVLRLGRVLGRLPPRVILIGVECRRFVAGAGLSPAVREAATAAAAGIVAELAGTARPGPWPGGSGGR